MDDDLQAFADAWGQALMDEMLDDLDPRLDLHD